MAIEEHGLREATLRNIRKPLKVLAKNVDLNDAEQVKSFTANSNAKESGTQLILPQVIRIESWD
jgi:lipopolysaccharide export system protein LptA